MDSIKKTSPKGKILIVTGNKYPEGDAGAIREHAFANIFRSLGYEPVIFGMGETTEFQEKNYEGIRYYSLRYKSDNLIVRILGRILFTQNLKWVISKKIKTKVSGILVVSGNESTFHFAEKLSKKEGIPLLHDSVEWYSPCEFSNGEKNREYKENNKLNTKIINKSYKVIAISSYLEKYFRARKIPVLRVPVIMDINKLSCRKRTHPEYIKIVYAGSIAGKDRLMELIQAMRLLPEESLGKIRLEIIGSTKEDFEKKLRILGDSIPNNISFIGRIPRYKVVNKLEEADFTFLLRPENERYAQAGFPTKIVESLASGTPIICNYTSDLDKYLVDMDNAIIVKDCSVESCRLALIRVISITVEQRHAMQKNARLTAERNFDWKLYIELFSGFIEG